MPSRGTFPMNETETFQEAIVMRNLLILSLSLFFAGCAGAAMQKETLPGMSYGKANVGSENDTAEAQGKSRILIYNAYYRIECADTEKTSKSIESLARDFGGYIVSAGTDEVKIRVLSDKFETALAEVEKTGDVESKKIYTEDVTDAYRDTEIRLDNKLKARERYLELLKKAENVNAAVNVERELERLNTEIEEMKGRLKSLSHLSKYSTITVSIEEKVKPGPLGYIFIGAWKVIKWMFVRN